MKKLGFLVTLLVSTTSFYGTVVIADSLTAPQPPVETKLTLVLNDIAMVQPKINTQVKAIELDQTAVLEEVNLALEQKVNQKLEALLAAQVLNLEAPTLAQK